jgi:hypothetical protein
MEKLFLVDGDAVAYFAHSGFAGTKSALILALHIPAVSPYIEVRQSLTCATTKKQTALKVCLKYGTAASDRLGIDAGLQETHRSHPLN